MPRKVDRLNSAQDHRNKDNTELAQMVAHGGLQQVHAFQSVGKFRGRQQHNHGRAAADDQCIDEHAQRLQQTRLGRMINMGSRCRTGCGAAARLVGEQAALGTVHDHGADTATHYLAQAKCLGEDLLEHSGQQRRVFHDNEQSNEEIAGRHDRAP